MAKLKITQVKSVVKRVGKQRRIVEALGLRGMHQTVEHNDTPQIRGMIEKVLHIVKVENA
ncbi:MAG: 50S ribosomal protein L30 [Bacteroidetes bacterium]|nr:50S ribosomal protein L30 [Bacteroidota bacterium]